MSTLFVGDLHAKSDLLPLIGMAAIRERADRIVLLGDICDDWNVSNNGLIRFFDTFASWCRHQAAERETIPLLGNHDVPYYLKQGSAAYARARALAPGFKPGAHRKVHELMQNIPFQLAWSDGNILATHAGLTRTWGRRRLGVDYMDMPVEEVADRLNRMLLHPASLAVPMTDIGPARGGAGVPSPLWCDRGEFARDGDTCLTHVCRLMAARNHKPERAFVRISGWTADRPNMRLIVDVLQDDGETVRVPLPLTSAYLLVDAAECDDRFQYGWLDVLGLLPEHVDYDRLDETGMRVVDWLNGMSLSYDWANAKETE